MFAAGERPNYFAIRDFVKSQRSVSISHSAREASPLHLVSADGEMVQSKPQDGPGEIDESGWVELLHNGLTFDVIGLASSATCEIPEIQHRFDFDKLGTDSSFEALQIVPGVHLVGGQASMPVVKGMVALARDFANHFDAVVGIVWPPSRSAIGRRFFDSISTAWLEGGAFPALGLTAFRQTMDGALQSVGLEYWVGQEVRIEKPLSDDKVAATRLGVRIVNHIVLSGGLRNAERIMGPDRMPLVLKLSRNEKFIRVWPDL